MSHNTTIAEANALADEAGSTINRTKTQILRFFLVSVLSLAVVAKLHQFVVHPPVGSSLWESRWLSVAAVLLEFVLIALWVTRLYSVKTRVFTIFCFSIFAVVSLVKWISGAKSCGCFGEILVPPFITFWLDVSVVVWLILIEPHERHSDERRRKRALSVAAIILSGGLGTVIGLVALSSIARLAANGDISGSGRVILFDPAEWKGKNLPILEHIEVPVDLQNGSHLILMIHHDCPVCQKVLREFLEKRQETGKKGTPHHDVIEVPPYSEKLKVQLNSYKENYTFGRLSNSRTWFIETPIFLEIENGILIDYHQ